MDLLAAPLLRVALLAGVVGAALGWLAARLRHQRQLNALATENARLAAEREAERRHHAAQLKQLRDARDELGRHFAALSQRALRQNSSFFLRLAEQNLKLQQARAEATLEQREQHLRDTVRPLQEALARAQAQIRELEQARQQAWGALDKQLAELLRSEQALRDETRHLVQALRRPGVRGRWGELTLRRLVELAGMVAHADFAEQVTAGDDGQRLRPDLVIRLPDQRELIVDAKTPLDAYLDAIDADDEAAERAALQRHARHVRERVRELAGKAYWAQFPRSPDFVVLFLPGEPFLSAALEQDGALLEDAMRQKVIPCGPAGLMALLRAVAFGWRQAAFSENAEQIRAAGEALYQRVATLTEHLERLGKGLNASVAAYNQTLGSLERQLMPGARRLAELGIQPRKTPRQPGPVEQTARPPQIPPGGDTEGGA